MNQSYEQDDQCFIPSRQDEQIYTRSHKLVDDVLQFSLSSFLPSANQIMQKQQPIQMVAKTCFLELNLKLYPELLDKGDELLPEPTQQSPTKKYIQNQEQKNIKQFYNLNDYKIIYNRISQYCSLKFVNSQLMNRFKNVSIYEEYNQKLFQTLQPDTDKKQPIFLDDDYFDSNFQCGNLGRVYIKLREQAREYYLLLENDVNSHGYTCWFFFKVLNCGVGKVKFHIINLVKNQSMFRKGMKISIFSMKKWEHQQIGWYKGGENIQTYQNRFPKQFKQHCYYSTLYFEYTFSQPNDQVYFAMSRPYSYSRVLRYIKNNFPQTQSEQCIPNIIEQNQSNSSNSQIQIKIVSDEETPAKTHYSIVKDVVSICHNSIPIIEAWKGQTNKQQRKAIVIMGRQHPAQIIGSQVMQEVMNIFSQNREDQQQQLGQSLLEKFLIVLIPMVNPDGVIHGNSRCNLAGLDLNRNWMESALKQTSPQTAYLRKYLWNLHQKQQIQFLIDLHGHSKKVGSFFFCNKTTNKFSPYYFPCIMSKIQQRFSLPSCTFKTTSDKQNTLRNQLYQDGMKNCITFQHSYHGFIKGGNQIKSFTKDDFRSLAESLVKGLNLMMFGDNCEGEMNTVFKRVGISRDVILSAAMEIQKNQIMMKNKSKSKSDQQQQLQLESDSQPEQGLLKPDEAVKIFSKIAAPQKKKKQIKTEPKKKPKKTDNQQLQIGKKNEDINRKKFVSRNFRREVLKRKKMMTEKEEALKFRRFQTFMDTSKEKQEIRASKIKGNSVFYHFPVL